MRTPLATPPKNACIFLAVVGNGVGTKLCAVRSPQGRSDARLGAKRIASARPPLLRNPKDCAATYQAATIGEGIYAELEDAAIVGCCLIIFFIFMQLQILYVL